MSAYHVTIPGLLPRPPGPGPDQPTSQFSRLARCMCVITSRDIALGRMDEGGGTLEKAS
jgi:hypothetical protein